MSEHATGTHRSQTVLFTDTIDKYLAKENPVRFIDAFIDGLNVKKFGFKHSVGLTPEGLRIIPRAFSNSTFGYLNHMKSSRKLEIEFYRKVEVMWLRKKLVPDFKTIADFRKDTTDRIKVVLKEFVYLCKTLYLYGAQLVAIEGTKFKDVNFKGNNLNEKTLVLKLKQTEEKIEVYLKEIDKNDKVDSAEDEGLNADELKEKICKLEAEKQRCEQIQGQMKAAGQKEVSLVDPDSLLMRVDSQRLEVGYNIQRDYRTFM